MPLLPQQTEVPNCFACGAVNLHGARLRFETEGDAGVFARFTAPAWWTGWGEIVHGGFQSLLLDEAMSWAVWGRLDERAFVTRTMSASFRRPVYVGVALTVHGRVVGREGDEVRCVAEIRDEAESVLAEGSGVIRILDPAKLGRLSQSQAHVS